MFNLTLRELNKKAEKTSFQRDTLEKVLRLGEVLQFIQTTESLKDHLVLKGGTAIHLTVFSMLRLSVDIDLDFHATATKDEMNETREHMNDTVKRYMASQDYHLSDSSKHTHSLDSFVFQYKNLIGNPDNIAIEINYSNRCHLFEPVRVFSNTSVIHSFPILTLSKIDLFGSKIAALIDRTTPRDVYDVHQMMENRVFRADEFQTLKKAAIFYLSLSNDQPKLTEMVENACVKISRIDYRDVKRALIPVLKQAESFDFRSAFAFVDEFLKQLFVLTDEEQNYLKRFDQGFFEPQLLFSDTSVIARIKDHPMAIWKVQHRKS